MGPKEPSTIGITGPNKGHTQTQQYYSTVEVRSVAHYVGTASIQQYPVSGALYGVQ